MHQSLTPSTDGKYDIGECRSLRITCVSEMGWFDNDRLTADIKSAGGETANQWEVPWDPKNAAGSCSLVEVETLGGGRRRFLLDAGWNREYMDAAFQREGIDRMLTDGEIDFLFISHEHMDHYWGLETVLKYRPDIPIIIPSTFHREGRAFLDGTSFSESGAENRVPHRGERTELHPGKVYRLMEGCAAAVFDLKILIGVRGEESLYFNVKDKGIVCVTGCCHQNILKFADFARDHLAGGDRLHGIYGGLHIAPFGPLKDEQEAVIQSLGRYGFEKIACNHCTGAPAVARMRELGYPVAEGRGRQDSDGPPFIGNGDTVEFG